MVFGLTAVGDARASSAAHGRTVVREIKLDRLLEALAHAAMVMGGEYLEAQMAIQIEPALGHCPEDVGTVGRGLYEGLLEATGVAFRDLASVA